MGTLYLKLHCHHQNQRVGRDGDSIHAVNITTRRWGEMGTIPKASLSPPDPGGGERDEDSIPKASLSLPNPEVG